ncbi:MAG TPA: PAS domain S-box protein [Steroidobacteraceae bacterium]|nr:PAS domain S-box protein [Steroidobacteraceae bacterium]
MNGADGGLAGQEIEALLGETGPQHIEKLFRNTVEDAPVGIAFADREGRYRYCNRAFCAMLGYDAEELKSESMASLTHGADVQSTTAGLERLWSGEIAHLDVEKRYLRKNGGALWVHATTSLVNGGGPRPECSVEFLLDISAQKQMAAALLQNQTLLATVIAELPIALLACDVRGQVTHHNRAAAELLGIPAEETVNAVPRNPYPLTAEVYLADGITPVPREDRPLARTLLGEKVRDAEFVIVRPDGVRRTVLSSAQRLVGRAGQPLGALAVIEDITERRLAEEELERVHKQLLVASRQAGMAEVATNVLHNVGNVLNSVNVSASIVSERLRKSKGAGLARVAALLSEHAPDLTTFLTGSQGAHLPVYLQELAADLIAERDAASAELAVLRGNVEHIKEIVAMQQSYARRGGVTEMVDIRTLVEDSLRMNEGAFSRHGVTLVRDFQEVPLITVDKHKVLQILVNVIRNAKYACDASGGAEKRVTVRVRATNSTMLIAVIDTGVGIPPENLERIFSHGFTTRKDGHGFGLHSCALAAKDLGGSLTGESVGLGQGATFTLTLPLTQPEQSRGR